MKTTLTSSLCFFITTFSGVAQILLNPPQVDSFSDLKDDVDVAFTNAPLASIYPPDVQYELHGGIFTFSSSFETNILNLIPEQDYGTYQLQSLFITESTNSPVTRYWKDSAGASITNTSTSGYVPDTWVTNRFTAPVYLSGQALEYWKAGYRLSRQTMRIDLIATNQVDAYNTALSNAYTSTTNQLPTNTIGALQLTQSSPPPTWHITLQATTNAAQLGIYETVDLLNPFPWFLITELPTDSDPIFISLPLNEERRVLSIANHSLDTDNDGLLDATELYQIGTELDESDTDGDGLDDYEEVMIYRSSPLLTDTDGDGMDDGDEVTNGFNPAIANPEDAEITIISPVEGARWL